MRNERLWGMDVQLGEKSTAQAFREEIAAAFRTGVTKLIFFRWNARKISCDPIRPQLLVANDRANILSAGRMPALLHTELR